MPLQATSGAASYDAFGGGVAAVPVFIEDTFSTFVYAGNSTNRSIVNDIDLSGKGGLVWIKDRDFGLNHTLFDTARGATKFLCSDNTNAEGSASNTLTAFNSNGFNLGTNSGYVNGSGYNYASWTFRKQPKFFDVVTYTGNGTAGRTVAHNLGSVPGCIMVKSTSGTGAWVVYHRGVNGGTNPQNYGMTLNATAAQYALTNFWNDTAPTSTVFTVGAAGGETNETGVTYVAYLFAHNAGGFGLTGTDNVISCGSVTTPSSGITTVDLGYEPQWLLIKRSDGAQNWFITDNMQGFSQTFQSQLSPNTSDAENTNTSPGLLLTSTGFSINASSYGASRPFIYIAIRRGPMKVPTSGTSVFKPTLVTGNGTNDRQITGVGFPPDLLIGKTMGTTLQPLWYDKLRGKRKWLESSNTLAEQTLGGGDEGLMLQDGFVVDNRYGSLNINTRTYVDWVFRRAPSFFDEVCYTGTGSQQNITHNLGVAPELIFVKSRSAANGGLVYNKTITASKYLKLFFTGEGDRAVSNDTGGFAGVEPTSSVFTVGTYNNVNGSGSTYVAYLFTSCAGVSKVFNYTGNGSSQTINCGFTSGARLVLIKRTDAIGDWYIWDSARGIVSGNDPHLSLNTTDAEVTTDDTIDTDSTGFVVNQVSATNVNVSSATYIGLAIA